MEESPASAPVHAPISELLLLYTRGRQTLANTLGTASICIAAIALALPFIRWGASSFLYKVICSGDIIPCLPVDPWVLEVPLYMTLCLSAVGIVLGGRALSLNCGHSLRVLMSIGIDVACIVAELTAILVAPSPYPPG
jgi:hypothetical protein